MMRSALLLGLALTLVGGTATAQDHPDFSGTWKLNAIKSDAMRGRGGQMGAPREILQTINQTADELTIEQEMGQNARKLTYHLDGTESTNAGMRGGESKSTAKWDGKKLVIETTATFEGPNGSMTMKSKEIRTLSDDGKTMTVTTTTESPRGTNTRKMVFDKQ
jgi:hypothetical protein